MVLNTKKWRVAIEAVRKRNGWGLLPLEKGWVVNTVKPLGKPARHLLKRVQDYFVSEDLLDEKYANGELNTPTQNLLIPPTTMGEKAIAYARTQLGTHESPWGSNRGKDVLRYQTSTGAYGEAWCASFVWYCYQKAGYKGPTSAGAWDTTDHYGLRVSLKNAQHGDLVSLNTGSGHVGILLRKDEHEVELIAGNTSNAVKEKSYPNSMIHSICRPNPKAK